MSSGVRPWTRQRRDMKSTKAIFVGLVLSSFLPFAVAFLLQQFKFPAAMRGASPSSFRRLVAAYRNPADSLHGVARIYVFSVVAFAALLIGAVIVWQFVDIGPKA
nr:putative integron gene cassette protein [uncultured bacterium]